MPTRREKVLSDPTQISVRQINQAELEQFVRQIIREELHNRGSDVPGPSTLPNDPTNPVM